MIAFGRRKPQSGSNAVQYLTRGRSPAALLKPGVPGRADIRELGNLFAAQARRTAAAGQKTKRSRVNCQTACP